MIELNLNSFVTFYWLTLSAGLLLPVIWFLIDYKINHSFLNLILQRFYLYDKINTHGYLPKSYFRHFYIVGLLINLILFILHLSSFLLFILFLLHISRRLYECFYIHQFHSTIKINCFYYLLRLIHYPCVGLTIISDYQYSSTNITLFKYFLAWILFLNASYIQYHVHLTLAKLNRSKNELYPIPHGYWMFNYLSCPNYLAEIVIYGSFFLTSHRTSAMASLLIWVFANQSFSALLNHRWYCRYYKDSYPTTRCALIPFIL